MLPSLVSMTIGMESEPKRLKSSESNTFTRSEMSGTQHVHWADKDQVDAFVKKHGKHPAIDNFMVAGEDTTKAQKALLVKYFRSRESFPKSHMTSGGISHNEKSNFFSTDFVIMWPNLTGKQASEDILHATASTIPTRFFNLF